jgi:nucleoside-diphosphate-sugar epimerase
LVIILGLGFTGSRVAWRLIKRGIPVAAAVRDPARFTELASAGLRLVEWSLGAGQTRLPLPGSQRLLHSIPTLPAAETAELHNIVDSLEPARVVYISSTGVYGGQQEVDENTEAAPTDSRGQERINEEAWVSRGPWTSMILRAAAIYGPGRGVHTALREGRMPRGSGAAVVSRVHVDDLAAITDAALFSDLGGAWPVADERPCSSAEILDWCRRVGGAGNSLECPREFPISGRKVDGRKVRELLGVPLKYPSWETGVLACLAEEEY